MDAKNLAERYDLPTLTWEPVAARLDAGFTQAPGTGGPDRHTCWLATIDADGKPHLSGIGAEWHDGTWRFSTGLTSRKGRNLVRDPRCTLSVALHDFDLVVEGEAHLVTDPGAVAAYAARAAADGWPAEPTADGTAVTAPFSAPSAGPPPWHVFELAARTAMVLQTVEPGGATRFTF
jgi:hypothetical protein